ncbi:MAG: hypothetical protein GY795_22310 [Desulfobacterales bacterium]|nr:hypothetical protein [Desulfobacterales bacterium]
MFREKLVPAIQRQTDTYRILPVSGFGNRTLYPVREQDKYKTFIDFVKQLSFINKNQ